MSAAAEQVPGAFEGTVPRRVVGFKENGNALLISTDGRSVDEVEVWCCADGSPVFRRLPMTPVDQTPTDGVKLSTEEKWKRAGF